MYTYSHTWYCIIKSFTNIYNIYMKYRAMYTVVLWGVQLTRSSGEMLQKRVDRRKPLRMQALGILVTFTPLMASQFHRRRGIPLARPKNLKGNTRSMECIGRLNKFHVFHFSFSRFSCDYHSAKSQLEELVGHCTPSGRSWSLPSGTGRVASRTFFESWTSSVKAWLVTLFSMMHSIDSTERCHSRCWWHKAAMPWSEVWSCCFTASKFSSISLDIECIQ